MDISTPEELAAVSTARDLLALYRDNEDLVNIGAYTKGASERLDLAIAKHDPIVRFLKQGVEERCTRVEACAQLTEALK